MIETKRLILKRYTTDDFKEYFQLHSCKEVWTYSTFLPLENKEQGQKLFKRLVEHVEDERIGFLAVFEKNSGNYIGEAGIISYVSSENKGEIGYNLLPEFWGQGYGIELVEMILRYAFNRWHMEKIEAVVISMNTASCHVLEKAGFLPIKRNRKINKYQTGYCITRQEWRQNENCSD